MEPTIFAEANRTLEKPPSMTDAECSPLPVFTDGEVCISKWKLTLKERLHALLRGYVWLGVHSGNTQPPVYVIAKGSIFERVSN
jgi:hypothetical protein